MKKPKYRLSPNEVERLVKEERDRRRKLRIVQVREQAKASAASIRNDVRKEKERLLNKFANEVEEQLTAEKDEKIRKLRQKYEGTLRGIGEGHREAYVKGDGYSAVQQLQLQQEAEEAAQDRFDAALKKQRLEDASREHEQRRHIMARQAALEVERVRATEIASLPPPAPDICLDMDKKSRRAVQMMDMKAFATSHFHIPDYQVVRAAPQEQTDAKCEGEDTDLKLKQDLAEKKRSLHEQKERARIRGNEALQKEMLKHDLGDMLQDLSLLQRRDRRRRQNVLADVPKQVFIPPERCLEERQERQIEMERKFDELYMQQYNDGRAPELQSIELSEYPTTQDSASASVHESSDTVDAIIPMSRINPALRDLTNVHQQPDTSKDKQPDSVLKQLLTKIRAQRNGPSGPGSAGVDQPQVARPTDTVAKLAPVLTTDNLIDADKLDSDSVIRPLAGNLNLSQFSQPTSSPESKGRSIHSDVDFETVAANDKMIEELMTRIKLIELQKEQLSRQFETQTGALDSLLRPSRSHTDTRSVEAPSLKEVDIEDSHHSRTGGPGSPTGEMPMRIETSDIDRRLKMRAMEQEQSGPPVDLAEAMSKLRPVSGIFKGERNLQYELLTSNGFLPSPEISVGAKVDGKTYEIEQAPQGEDREVTSWIEGGKGDAEAVREMKLSDSSGGARREIDFGVETGGNLGKHLLGVGQGLGQLDSGDSQFVRGPGAPYDMYASAGMGEGFSSSLHGSGQSNGANSSSLMSEKIRQYAENAGARHAGMDAETAQRVRDYQHQLLQNQSDRRNMLAQVRADIEARRRQLYSSKQSFLGSGIPGVPQDAGIGVPVSGGENVFRAAGGLGDGKTFDMISGMRSDPLKDSLEGRGGLLLSSWASRHQEQGLQAATEGTSISNTNRWEPIKPFVADPGRYQQQQQQMFASGHVQPDTQHVYGHHWELPSETYPANPMRREVEITNEKKDSAGSNSRAKDVLTKDKEKRDKVRKSLSFEEKEAGEDAANVSQVSWKDVLNDTASCGKAWATSEEEESSSPVLARSHASLDNSGRGADKSSDISGRNSRAGGDRSSDVSVGDKSSVLTGSSSLNGSALVARAEERRVGFERRQAELKQQLMDIQQQKDSILERYQAGQAALHQQQAALREKLLVAAAGGSQVESEAPTAVSAGELVQAATSGPGNPRTGPAQTWAASLAQGSRQDSGASKRSTQSKSGEQVDSVRSAETISPTYTEITHSGRQSLASAGTPGNVSTDSFLADISYYKLKHGDSVSLPSSAFQVQPDGSTKVPFTIPKRDSSAPLAGNAGQRQTWATLLQTSSGPAQQLPGDDNSTKSYTAPVITKNKPAGLDVVFPQKSASPSPPSGFESPSSSPTLVPALAPQASVYTAASLAEHQPHELSTIMEVDTPTSSSTKRYGGQQQKQRHLLEMSNSSQSLSSQASSTAQGSRAGNGGAGRGRGGAAAPVIDTFPELPFTFSRPAMVFDLTADPQSTDLSSKGASLKTVSGKPIDVQVSAKQSINFSQESSLKSQSHRTQPLMEREKSGDDDDRGSDYDGEDDLLSMPMPFLVENTPGKSGALSATADTSSDTSSLQISGYSEYLKGQQAAGTFRSASMTGDGRAKGEHITEVPLSEELALASRTEEDATWIPQELRAAARNAEQFGPDVVLRLRQQSRDIFGDSTTNISEREGDRDQNQSALTGEMDFGTEGDMSRGNRSSMPSMDLEEISIQDTTGEH